MKAISHNVAALDQVLGLAAPVFDSYKPGNASIERTALTALLEESKKSITAVHTAYADYHAAMNRRQQAFSELPRIGLYVYHLAECNGMNEKDLAHLNTVRARFISNPFKSEKALASSEEENSPLRRNRQLGFAQKAATLEAIITMLDGHPNYPTEAEWSVSALRITLAEMQQHSIAVAEKLGVLTKARAEVKQLVFDRKNGILGLVRKTKRYLRLTLGRKADLYRSISKIKFRG